MNRQRRSSETTFFMFMTVYYCMNVTPQCPANEILRIVVLRPLWDAFKLYFKAFSPDFTNFDSFSPFSGWFRTSTRRVRGGNVGFINASSNERFRDRPLYFAYVTELPVYSDILPFPVSQNLEAPQNTLRRNNVRNTCINHKVSNCNNNYCYKHGPHILLL